MFLYKIVTNMCPLVIASMFNRTNEIHKYMTRHPELFQFQNIYVLNKIVRHRSVKLWNCIVKTIDYRFIDNKTLTST